MERFQMANALLKRAKRHRNSIGDHGDPYEESLLNGEVTIELKIIIKEIFDHLRSALDYCARDISEMCLGQASEKPVYFPIVSHDFKREDFRSRVGRLIPGLLQHKPELEGVFASFQPFASSENNWISKFATLCNENKHEQLSVSKQTRALGAMWKDEEGNSLVSIKKDDGSPFRNIPLMIVENIPQSGTGECKYIYIKFELTGDEILDFLDECITGVENILNTLSTPISI